MPIKNRKDGNDQESIQLSHTSHQRHQREINTNTFSGWGGGRGGGVRGVSERRGGRGRSLNRFLRGHNPRPYLCRGLDT